MRVHDELAMDLARSARNLAETYFYKTGVSDIERVSDIADFKAKFLEILEEYFSKE